MDVLVVGAGGHGRVVLEILRAAGQHRAVGFLDADPSLKDSVVDGLPVLGHFNVLPKVKTRGAIVAIGDNRVRVEYAAKLREHGFELVNAVHPSAIVSPSATIGNNCVIAARAVIGTAARLGNSVIINTGAVVDHECDIADGVHICPAAALAGRVRVSERAFIGTGARVIPCISIGDDAIIGAGATVIRDVPSSATAVGVPAKVIKLSN